MAKLTSLHLITVHDTPCRAHPTLHIQICCLPTEEPTSLLLPHTPATCNLQAANLNRHSSPHSRRVHVSNPMRAALSEGLLCSLPLELPLMEQAARLHILRDKHIHADLALQESVVHLHWHRISEYQYPLFCPVLASNLRPLQLCPCNALMVCELVLVHLGPLSSSLSEEVLHAKFGILWLLGWQNTTTGS